MVESGIGSPEVGLYFLLNGLITTSGLQGEPPLANGSMYARKVGKTDP